MMQKIRVIMVKNIRILVLAFGVMFLNTAATAEVAIGVTAAATLVEASGYERLKTTDSKTSGTYDDHELIPSLWVEATNEDLGLTVGLEFIPMEAEVGAGGNTGDDDAETSGTNTVSVDFKDHKTVYLAKTLPMFDGLYIKAGLSTVTLVTNDNVSTGAKYGDKSMDGVRVGLGVKRDVGTDWLGKIELEHAQYEGATFYSTGSDAVTTVDLESFDTTALRFSFGRKF